MKSSALNWDYSEPLPVPQAVFFSEHARACVQNKGVSSTSQCPRLVIAFPFLLINSEHERAISPRVVSSFFQSILNTNEPFLPINSCFSQSGILSTVAKLQGIKSMEVGADKCIAHKLASRTPRGHSSPLWACRPPRRQGIKSMEVRRGRRGRRPKQSAAILTRLCQELFAILPVSLGGFDLMHSLSWASSKCTLRC
jgi:hypothetical protein